MLMQTLILVLITACQVFSQYNFVDENTWKKAYRMIELSRASQCDEAIILFEQMSIDTAFKHRNSYIAIAKCLQRQGKDQLASELIKNAVSNGILAKEVHEDSITHPKMAQRFLSMYLEDQGAWSINDKFILDPESKESLIQAGIDFDAITPQLRRMPAIELHKLHVKELEELVKENGFPTAEMVGHVGLKGVRIVILHAKKEILEKYESEYKSTFGSYAYAYLIDKLRVSNGEKQLYGTQGDFDKNKQLIFYPIEDEINVNKRRMNADMEPIEIYAKNLGVLNYQIPVHNKLR